MKHRHRLVDSANLRPVADADRLGEVDAAVGVDGSAVLCVTDRDQDGARIDGVGAEDFRVVDRI